MSNAKVAKPVVFPMANEPLPTKPAWLDDLTGGPLKKLFEAANDDAVRAPSMMPPNERASMRPSEMPPSAAGASQYPGGPGGHAPQPSAAPPQPSAAPQSQAAQAAAAAQAAQAAANAAANAAQRAAEAAAAAQPEHAEHAHEEQHDQSGDERPVSKFPPPPKLGSLIPGARSAPPVRDAGFELLQEQREAFTNAAMELAIARTATMTELEGQLLDLSIEIASALIEREVEKDPALHSTLARAALSSLGDADRVTLSTSPNAYEAICETLGGPEAKVNGVHVTVHADEAIPGLGCVVDGQNVRIDATVAERLRAVRRAFEDERRKVAENTE